MANTKREARQRRKTRIRQKVKGTPERPRLTVFRSLRHIYAQVVDDENNKVLVTASTNSKTAAGEITGKKKVDQAKLIGAKLGAACKGKGIEKVVFDRNGYQYHGRVLVLAKAVREAGVSF